MNFPKSKLTLGILLAGGALAIMIVALIIVSTSHLPQKKILENYLGYPTFFCFLIFAVLLVIKIFIALINWIKTIRQHPVRVTLTLLISVGIIVFIGILIYRGQRYNGLPNKLFLTQETLSEAAAAKEVGDLLAAGNSGALKNFDWQGVEKIADNTANTLSKLNNSVLSDYQKAGIAWAEKIRDAAKDQEKWKGLPAEPDDFTIKLTDSKAEELFNKSLAKTFELAQFGTDAVRREDKEAMRYIAAKLLVQEHWLKGLSKYQTAGIFSGLINPVYAQDSSKKKFDKEDANSAASFVLALKLAALEYSAAGNTKEDKAAAEAWKKAAFDMCLTVAETNLAPQVLAGLIEDAKSQLPPDQQFIKEWSKAASQADLAPQILTDLIKNAATQSPPQAQAFKDDCLAKGGMLGGIARTNEWLATTEDGYYCRFKQEEKTCWKFLSYSGGIASGGEGDCKQENILPSATGPNVSYSALVPQTPATTPSGSQSSATSKTKLRDLGTPTGTASPKIQFTLPQSKFTAKVNEPFSYSFCQPASAQSSDLCTAASTNPRYGLPPYTFYLDTGGFLPFGLTLNLNGLLEGTPAAEGSRTVGICAKDTGGFSVCRQITINVVPAQSGIWDGWYGGRLALNHPERPDQNCYAVQESHQLDSMDVLVKNNHFEELRSMLLSDMKFNNGNIDSKGAVSVQWSGGTSDNSVISLQFSGSGSNKSLTGTIIEDLVSENRWGNNPPLVKSHCEYSVTASWTGDANAQ